MSATAKQHYVEVKRVGYLKRAECSCGWQGRQFDVGKNAQKDGDEHIRATGVGRE